MAIVNTVTGPRETSELGQTLMHEHLFVLTPEINRDFPEISWRGDKADRIAQTVEKLKAAKARGIDTIVDLTVLGMDRYIPNIQRVLAEVNMNVIVATGIYTYDHLPHFFELHAPAKPADRDILTEIFVSDIQNGIGDSGAKAAILKCCTDKAGVTPNIDRILRAVARAHRETGVPISTHSDPNLENGLDQQRIFAAEGVDLTRVVIGHSGDTTNVDYLKRVMDQGSTIGCDRFGLYGENFITMNQRIDTIVQLCAEGYADRIVLSHDSICHLDWMPESAPNAMPDWVLTHVSDKILPALTAKGVTAAQAEQLMVGNPARIFEKQGSY
jgi:phosphotriesterase-related protein